MHIQLGDRLAELRKDHGYTQDYIAELLKVTRSSDNDNLFNLFRCI